MTKRRGRRIIAAAAVLALAIVALDQQERYTVRRKIEAFSQRMSPITEGMPEAEVRRIAGAPEEFVARLSDSVDPSRLEWCVKAGASTAMIYSVERAGWLSSKLRVPAGITSRVVCLGANRRVVKTYASFIDY